VSESRAENGGGGKKVKIGTIYVVLELFILRKLFPVPYAMIALVLSNSICRN
jgi:hypothetical protein